MRHPSPSPAAGFRAPGGFQPGALGASAYARMGTQTAALAATPHQLITMLFDALDRSLRMARHHMRQGDTLAKGNALSKAIDIIDNGLKAGLDSAAGGPQGAQLVEKLSMLYDYVTRQLMLANLHNDLARLEEAERLIGSVGSAWREVGLPKPATPAQEGQR